MLHFEEAQRRTPNDFKFTLALSLVAGCMLEFLNLPSVHPCWGIRAVVHVDVSRGTRAHTSHQGMRGIRNLANLEDEGPMLESIT